jgi:hypothetical protein
VWLPCTELCCPDAAVIQSVIQAKLFLHGLAKLLFSKPASFVGGILTNHNIPHDKFHGE